MYGKKLVCCKRRNIAENDVEASSNDSEPELVAKRRVLRSRYLAVQTLISDERDDLSRVDSDKFNSIINERFLQKPREQAVDAEALLNITNTLITSVKAHSQEGITPFRLCKLSAQRFQATRSGKYQRRGCCLEDGNIPFGSVEGGFGLLVFQLSLYSVMNRIFGPIVLARIAESFISTSIDMLPLFDHANWIQPLTVVKLSFHSKEYIISFLGHNGVRLLPSFQVY
ncbi:unnamed protein product [Camellia sinensis]